MGQYYRVVLESNGNKANRTVYEPYAYLTDEDGIRFVDGCGAKLTEHSGIGNAFTDGIANVLFVSDEPMTVAWVGDYTKDVYGGKFFRKAYRSKKAIPVEGCKFDYTGKYLLNFTKCEYVSYDHYLATVKSNRKEYPPYNPLSLLTAVGNGFGGGDYYGENRCEYSTYDMIGSWVGDLIKIGTSVPESWTEIFPKFVEYFPEEYIKELEEISAEREKPDSEYFKWCVQNDCLNKPLKQLRLVREGNWWY